MNWNFRLFKASWKKICSKSENKNCNKSKTIVWKFLATFFSTEKGQQEIHTPHNQILRSGSDFSALLCSKKKKNSAKIIF